MTKQTEATATPSAAAAGRWRIAILISVLLSGAGTAFAVRAYNNTNREAVRPIDEQPSHNEAAGTTGRENARSGEPAGSAELPATHKPAAHDFSVRPERSGTVRLAAQGPAEAKARQLARVWVYWDAVYPSAIKLKPGTVLLRMENQVGFDVNLVLTKLTGGGTGHVTTLGAQGKTLRSIQVLELGAGLYEYYDQSRPQIKGRLIVEP
jgi:hypothetical protein